MILNGIYGDEICAFSSHFLLQNVFEIKVCANKSEYGRFKLRKIRQRKNWLLLRVKYIYALLVTIHIR